jgi:hypothetical protein
MKPLFNAKPVIYVPTLKPVCQVDGKEINPATEPGGKLYLVKGHPMCTMHRLMRRPVNGKLDYRKVFSHRKEEEKANLDKLAAKEVAMQKENQRVKQIAADSQEEAAQIDKRTKLTPT